MEEVYIFCKKSMILCFILCLETIKLDKSVCSYWGSNNLLFYVHLVEILTSFVQYMKEDVFYALNIVWWGTNIFLHFVQLLGFTTFQYFCKDSHDITSVKNVLSRTTGTVALISSISTGFVKISWTFDMIHLLHNSIDISNENIAYFRIKM